MMSGSSLDRRVVIYDIAEFLDGPALKNLGWKPNPLRPNRHIREALELLRLAQMRSPAPTYPYRYAKSPSRAGKGLSIEAA